MAVLKLQRPDLKRALELQRTLRFSVLDVGVAPTVLPAAPHCCSQLVVLPRVGLLEVGSEKCRLLLEERGFVVVNQLGEATEAVLENLRCRMERFFTTTELEEKELCVGSVYRNERGLPMYRLGYEWQRGVRESFRVAPALMDQQEIWQDTGLRLAWEAALRPLRDAADSALHAVLRGSRSNKDAMKNLQSALSSGQPLLPEGHKGMDPDDDFSIAYGFYYPNTADYGGKHCDDRDTLVAAHVDPSLVVIEPVSNTPGLQVFDPITATWLSVEDMASPRSELILFAGAALEHASKGKVPACKHRVVKSNNKQPRFSFIYEQKYAQFFTHLTPFGD